MSLGQAQYQQQIQPHQQHPLLAAVSGNNYALGTSRAHYPPRGVRPQRPMHGAGTNNHGVYATAGGGHSGYGYEPSNGYEYHPPASGHLVPPSGGGYAQQATSATAYGAPPPNPHPYPPAQPPPPPTQPAAKKKKGGSSSATIISALTLLSFFFFVNMLQGCLKEQMAAMNPTVMVMTVGGARNRFNKLAEMNSRERAARPVAAAAFTSGANIVVQPADLMASAASSAAAVAVAPTVTLHSPYQGGGGGGGGGAGGVVHVQHRPAASVAPHYDFTSSSANNNNNNHNNYNYNEGGGGPGPGLSLEGAEAALTSANHSPQDPRPEFYDSPHPYPNRTLLTSPAPTYHHAHQQQNYHGLDHEMTLDHDHGHYPSEYGQRPIDEQQHQGHHHQEQQQHKQTTRPAQHSLADAYPWSYGGAASSSASSYKRGGASAAAGAAWSSASLPAHATGNNYFDADRYDDSYYTRIN